MAIQEEIVLGLLVGIYVLFLVLEFVAARVKQKGFASDEYTLINLSLALMQQSAGVMQTALFMGGFIYVQEFWSLPHLAGFPEIEANWPLMFSFSFPWVLIDIPMLMTWVLVIVIADFCQYWLHRLSHEVNMLWAGHVVHHSNTEYNFSVALRQSFIEGFYTWVFYLPLAFLGVPWELFISAYAVSLLWQFLVHTRFVNKMGMLEKFMSTPSHHRVHHGRNKIYLDKNYGAFFIIWDKMFGTFREETEEPAFGITVPVESNNLLWINTHQYAHIWKHIKNAGTWKDRWKSLFGLPSFVPAGMEPPEVGEERVPVAGHPEKKAYVFVSFLLTGITGVWMVNYFHATGQIFHYLMITFLLMGSFVTICSLLDNTTWADNAEVGRLFVFTMLGLYFVNTGQADAIGWILVLFSVLLLLLTVWVADSYRQKLAVK